MATARILNQLNKYFIDHITYCTFCWYDCIDYIDNLREEEVMAKYRIKKTSEGYKIQKRLFWFIYDTYGYEGVTEYGTVRSGTIFYKTKEEAIKYLDEIRTEEKQKPKMKKEEVVYEID